MLENSAYIIWVSMHIMHWSNKDNMTALSSGDISDDILATTEQMTMMFEASWQLYFTVDDTDITMIEVAYASIHIYPNTCICLH